MAEKGGMERVGGWVGGSWMAIWQRHWLAMKGRRGVGVGLGGCRREGKNPSNTNCATETNENTRRGAGSQQVAGESSLTLWLANGCAKAVWEACRSELQSLAVTSVASNIGCWAVAIPCFCCCCWCRETTSSAQPRQRWERLFILFLFFNQPVFLYNKHDNKEFGERIRQLKALYSLITENCGMYE